MVAKLIAVFAVLAFVQPGFGAPSGQAPPVQLMNTPLTQNNGTNPVPLMPAGPNTSALPPQGGPRSSGNVGASSANEQPAQQQAPQPGAPAGNNNQGPAPQAASIRTRRQAGIPPECCTKDPCDPCATTPCIACPRCG